MANDEELKKKVADLESQLATMKKAEKSSGQCSARAQQAPRYNSVDDTLTHARAPVPGSYDHGAGDMAMIKALTQLYAVGTAYFNAMKGAVMALRSLYGGQGKPAYAMACQAPAGYNAKGDYHGKQQG